MAVAIAVGASSLAAQTKITPPKNKYTPEQDVQIGQEAAAEVRKQYPLINDREIRDYLDDLGRRLVAATPPEYRQPAFEYSFTPVNLKEINAFALPGGPMFVNRGMIDAASREGEVAGVMAHELSHVLLRHGTANATKAQGFQIGALAGAIAGAVVGGGWGQVISQGSQFGLGTWLMKYSREYEKQADLLGAQIMARAGYDPRDLARMFETIQAQSKGSGGPEWMSSHPNPGNRSTYIAQEAAKLTRGAAPDCARLRRASSASSPRCRRPSRWPTSGAATRRWRRRERARLGRAHRRTGARAVHRLSRRPRRPVVPDLGAVELAGRDVEQRREVRAAKRLRSAQRRDGVHARRRAGRRQGGVARPGRVHRRAAQRAGAGQPEPAPGGAAPSDAGCRSGSPSSTSW